MGESVAEWHRRTAALEKEHADLQLRLQRRFLEAMHHEMRTPLNSIVGFSQLIAEDETISEATRECIEASLEGAGTLLGIIDQILEFARLTSRYSGSSAEEAAAADAEAGGGDDVVVGGLVSPATTLTGLADRTDLSATSLAPLQTPAHSFDIVQARALLTPSARVTALRCTQPLRL